MFLSKKEDNMLWPFVAFLMAFHIGLTTPQAIMHLARSIYLYFHKKTCAYRVSNLKLPFSFRLVWTYGWHYNYGVLVCYRTDLRQFFGVKKPDRKWPEMTKNDISSKYSIFLLILNIFLDAFFLWFLENAISIFHFEYTWDIFLVCTGCGSGIYNT